MTNTTSPKAYFIKTAFSDADPDHGNALKSFNESEKFVTVECVFKKRYFGLFFGKKPAKVAVKIPLRKFAGIAPQELNRLARQSSARGPWSLYSSRVANQNYLERFVRQAQKKCGEEFGLANKKRTVHLVRDEVSRGDGRVTSKVVGKIDLELGKIYTQDGLVSLVEDALPYDENREIGVAGPGVRAMAMGLRHLLGEAIVDATYKSGEGQIEPPPLAQPDQRDGLINEMAG